MDYTNPLYLKYATERQKEYLAAVMKHGSIRAAESALQVSRDVIGKTLRGLARRVARAEPSLHSDAAPSGYHLRGVSTCLNADGEVVLTWVKTSADRQQQFELLREALEEITDTSARRLAPLHKPVGLFEDRFTWYKIADAHIGMLAWATETGESFDLSIAEARYTDMFDRLVQSTPRTKKAAVVNLGDYFNVDGPDMSTTKGTPQDEDGRWPKLCKVGIRMFLYFVDRLLQKHEEVYVYCLAGNHDRGAGAMLAAALYAVYRDEPRVNVSIDPSAIQAVRYGRCLIGAAHGDQGKPENIPGMLSAHYAKDWGDTYYRQIYTGHQHRERYIIKPGCVVEAVRSATPNSAWLSTWHWDYHELRADVWDRECGIIGSSRVVPVNSPAIRPAQVVK
jgi:hypothetical protein